ncbi:hypothetical protein NDU88_000577 [Pleurodeles waltl]|uniref:Uncharacterized protein n=1 Tax=Pleurodeles waltl TaxID=8319 RepID=A0AAV7SX31_PLEWA|nr:hypothetical protein NDU88_000577 [Pleurodeles waltl]
MLAHLEIDGDMDDDDAEGALHTIHTMQPGVCPRKQILKCHILVAGQAVVALIDMGASLAISHADFVNSPDSPIHNHSAEAVVPRGTEAAGNLTSERVRRYPATPLARLTACVCSRRRLRLCCPATARPLKAALPEHATHEGALKRHGTCQMRRP